MKVSKLVGTSRYANYQVERNSGQEAVKCNGHQSRFRLAVSVIRKQESKKIISFFHLCSNTVIQRSLIDA